MPGISLDDRGAWDDSALINSWDEAVAEYQVSGSMSDDIEICLLTSDRSTTASQNQASVWKMP